MDRGAWIKNSERKACRRTQKRTKVQKHKKCKMAWEWGTNEYLFLPYLTIMWCLSWKLLKDRGKKWNSYSWPQKSYLDFEILVPIIPKLEYHQWLKYIHLSFRKSRHLEEFSMLVFIVKIVCCSKKKLSRDLCSLGSRQLLQLQHFSQNL